MSSSTKSSKRDKTECVKEKKKKRKHKKLRRSRSRSRSRSRHRYSSHYSRSRSRSRSASPYRKRRHNHRRRYRERRHKHSSQRYYSSSSSTHSRSRSPTHSPSASNVIKATAPNAMQQINCGNQAVADPLAAFNSVFGNLSRPAVLSLTNPIKQSNASVQQALAASNPYKLSCGLSGSTNSMNPLLMNQIATELQNPPIEQHVQTNKNDESLFLTVHLPGMNLTAIGGIHPQITRPARRLYVGNLPVGMGLTEQILTEFFNQCCKGLGIATLNPVLSVWLNSEQTFGFIEFRAVQDTNLALQLFDGLQLGGRQLRFGRPVDYKEPPHNLKNYVVGDNGPTTDKGSPAAMLLMRMKSVEQNANQDAQQSLDRAICSKQKEMMDAHAIIDEDDNKASNVLLLMNMIHEEDIKDDEEYEDIKDDIECECENYGTLLEVVIPKIGDMGCGRVFLKYKDVAQARKCKAKVDGRLFGKNTVKCIYFNEALFDEKKYDCDGNSVNNVDSSV